MVSQSDITLADGLRSPIIGKGILLAIITCLLATLGAGAAMRQDMMQQAERRTLVSVAQADDKRRDDKQKRPVKDLKEARGTAANGIFVLVLLNVCDLLLTRRQYAFAMVFFGRFARNKPRAAPC